MALGQIALFGFIAGMSAAFGVWISCKVGDAADRWQNRREIAKRNAISVRGLKRY